MNRTNAEQQIIEAVGEQLGRSAWLRDIPTAYLRRLLVVLEERYTETDRPKDVANHGPRDLISQLAAVRLELARRK